MMLRFVSLALLAASSACAFQASLPARPACKVSSPPSMTTPTRLSVIMSDEETDAILRTIEDCSEHTQCGVDDVSSLLAEMRQQQAEMTARLATMDKLIAQLQHLNQSSATDQRDEVRAFVRDMLRVFSTGGPAFPTTGFSGDIGNGPMTAYDALPPKKWKPSPETAN